MLWLIIGGSDQGKLALGSQQFKKSTGKTPTISDAGEKAQDISDKNVLEEQLSSLLCNDIIDHLHLFLRQLSNNCNQSEFDEIIESWLVSLHSKHNGRSSSHEIQIIIIDDIGSGVVPLELADRLWRERCGRLYCRLSEEAVYVQRVWAGIPQTIKETTRT